MNVPLPTGFQASLLGNRQRLHIQHGPTDLVIDADGPDRMALFEVAVEAMRDVLSGLADELPQLRAPFEATQPPSGQVARRMHDACAIAGDRFVTPMAAVAGAIADHVLGAMMTSCHTANATKISVNNGGDIAFWTADGATTRAALAGMAGGSLTLQGPTAWRGIATSGFGGRSLSPGIADSVTVLADCAARADVAATLIAGAVDCADAAGIERLPACEVDPDSDLGDRLVTIAVPELRPAQIADALTRGRDLATAMLQGGQMAGAVILLQGDVAIVGLDQPAAMVTARQTISDRPTNGKD